MVLGRQVIYPGILLDVNMAERPHCFLFDNGSLRAASTLSLRRVARVLETKIAAPVTPVSLLHSSAVPADQLEGVPAQILEPALLKWLHERPDGEAILLPLFFGPSGALTEYLPERLATIRAKFPDSRLRLAKWLVDVGERDFRIASALADAARKSIAENQLSRPKVLLVDHGSPQPGVAAVRDFLGAQVRGLLGSSVQSVGVASMERRPGSEYEFNEPLLSFALSRGPFSEGDVVILLQFLSPGRHAGPQGDIAQICEEAQRGNDRLRTYMTEPISADPRVVDVLVQRYQEALQTSLRGSISPTSSA
jgi:sirohydrochlorin ferrochelatase